MREPTAQRRLMTPDVKVNMVWGSVDYSTVCSKGAARPRPVGCYVFSLKTVPGSKDRAPFRLCKADQLWFVPTRELERLFRFLHVRIQ